MGRLRLRHRRPTRARSTRTFPGAFDQRHLLTVSTTAQLGERWDASATLRLATNWPYEGWFEERDDGRIVLSSERNALRLPDYGRLDSACATACRCRTAACCCLPRPSTPPMRTNYRQVSATINTRTFVVGRLSEKQLPIIPAVGLAYEF